MAGYEEFTNQKRRNILNECGDHTNFSSLPFAVGSRFHNFIHLKEESHVILGNYPLNRLWNLGVLETGSGATIKFIDPSTTYPCQPFERQKQREQVQHQWRAAL